MLTLALRALVTNIESPRETYDTVFYGDSNSLPMKVMMGILFLNRPDVQPELLDRDVLWTHTISTSVRLQMESDYTTVEANTEVWSTYTNSLIFHSRFIFEFTKILVLKCVVFRDAWHSTIWCLRETFTPTASFIILWTTFSLVASEPEQNFPLPRLYVQ